MISVYFGCILGMSAYVQWRNQALFGQIFEWQQHTHPQHNGPCKCLLGQIAKPQKCSIFILFYLCLIRGLLNNHTQHAILYIELKPNICSFAPFDDAFCECASSVIRFCDSISANVDQVAAMKLTKIGFFFQSKMKSLTDVDVSISCHSPQNLFKSVGSKRR